MFGIAGVIAVVASANAAETADIKAACQASDKTLWVERNKVCIPRNPCKDSKYEKYCNRMFKDVEVQEIGYKVLVEAFARTHGLSCVPIDTKSKFVGQDYVICMGTDVMVFEFDDISEHPLKEGLLNTYMHNRYPYVCNAIGGDVLSKDNYSCYGVTEDTCTVLQNVLEKYKVDAHTSWNKEKASCHMSISQVEYNLNLDAESKHF